MIKFLKRLLSAILVFALLINLLPLNVLALDTSASATPSVSSSSEIVSDVPIVNDTPLTDEQETPVKVVGEDITRRSEYGKEFLLSNGLHLATVYPTPVHYKEDGKWEEIDNTLTTNNVNGQSVYSSGKGLWRVDFPQQLTSSNDISITKDGYTVSFGMAGEMRSDSDFAVASVNLNVQDNSAEVLAIHSSQISSAQIQVLDLTAAKASAEFEETVLQKLSSRLIYPSVYNNTNVVYDLSSNRLKESIIIRSYDSALWGYRYELNTGGLVPVLNEDQSIDLLEPMTDVIVLSMPAPFMLDANNEYCDDVTVSLVQNGNSYQLSYYLPRDWMADENRAWPVVLDPVVEAGTTQNNILDHFVAEYYSASNSNGALLCGYYSDFGKMRTFIKFSNLPALSSADVLVKATMTLSFLSGGTSGTTAIGAHKVNADWATSTITWDNQPAHNNTVEDCVNVGTSEKYSWNITEIARNWYASANTGVMLKALSDIESGATSNWKKFYSVDYSMYDTDIWPSLTIQYRDAAGIEDYWDYTSSGAGRAGTGYVQNFTGNLVWVHNDIGFDGNRMPVSISHIYNAHDAWDGENNTGKNPFAMGNGWRTNFNQLIYVGPSGSYVWEDGDGTRHEFIVNPSGTTYKDNDDLGLTLTVSSTDYILTDKYDNQSIFDSSGRLIQQKNNQATASRIEISYDPTYPNRISTILDGASRKYEFKYDSGLLKTINYYGTGPSIISSISYWYVNANLTSITYADTKSSSFSYTSKNLLSTATDIDGYKLTYGYNTLSTGKPSKVTSVTESDGTAGGSTTFAYTYNRTVVTDHKENTQTLFFNIWGNTISVQDSEGRATFAQYATDVNLLLQRNRLLKSSQQQNTVVNLLTDTSFENSTMWTAKSPGDSIAIISDDGYTDAYMGSKCMKITTNTKTSSNGAYIGSFTVGNGESYTFSAHLKCDGRTQLAIVDDLSYAARTDYSNATEWTRGHVTYTNNTGAARTIKLHVIHNYTGATYLDCVQLEKNESASRYNLIMDGDITQGTGSGSNYAWQLTTGTNNAYDSAGQSAPGLNGNRIRINGNFNSTQGVEQTIKASGNKDDRYVFTGWVSGYTLPTKGSTTYCGLKLEFLNAAGEAVTAVTIYADPHMSSQQEWQYLAGEAIAGAAYTSIRLTAVYHNNLNYVYFDGLQLFKEEFGESYAYDNSGNVTQIRDVNGKITTHNYTDENDLAQTRLPTGITTKYTYDSHRNLKKSERGYLPANGSFLLFEATTYEYDEYGNVTKTTSEAGGVTKTTLALYENRGNTLKSTTNADGNTTNYSYNPDTGVLKSVKHPATAQINYVYNPDTFQLIKSYTVVNGEEMSAEYDYTDDMLTQIKTPSTIYSIAYGDFALRTKIVAGDKTLATYSYTNSKDRYLKSLDYGNNDKVEYTYDSLGRVTKEVYTEDDTSTVSRTITYAYDNSGALATMVDSKTGITTKYYYDTVGRITAQLETSDTLKHSLRYAYDEFGRISNVREYHNDTTWNTSYAYEDQTQRVERITKGVASENYTYDNFDRITGKTTSHNSSEVFSETITYAPTSDRVTSLALGTFGTYQYEYDSNGNITSVTKGDKTTNYVYDSANQLVRENNQEAGKTWVWTYNLAGNITSKKEYAYTTNVSPGTAIDTIVYGYPTSGTWKDLLTAYDGYSISYDDIGNILHDANWSYTWSQGRQLSSMYRGSVTWNFAYDANGMRTGRSYGSTAYTYVYNGSQLSYMTYGGNVMNFTYGADGSPLAINYNGSTYYYVVNLQGDVVAILDSSGAQVVGYTYDAWGRLLSTTGSKAPSLGWHNPLLYRGYVYDRETGLYYLQSRYYNPTIGRFINADGHVATGQGLTGNNMFAYCGNNPTTRADHSGESFAIVLGFNFNLFGWGVTASINLVSTEENFGVQYSYYLSDDAEISKKQNSTIGVDIGPYIGIQYTDKTSMEELEGYAKATGGDGFLGLDVLTEENGNYLGWQFGASAFSHNMHSFYTNTETLFSIPTINLFDIFTGWIFGG